MRNHLGQFILTMALAAGLSGLATGCRSTESANEEKGVGVSMAELSGPARATVERVTAGGRVEKITREVEKGIGVYDVEATVANKHLEFLIAEADGAVLGTEVPVDFAELPEPVRTAALTLFDSANGLKAMKGVEFGQTSYEIEGTKDGKTLEATFDPAGKRCE